MSTYPVTVVIPAHNASQTVKRAIDSAFEAGAHEVVVVNDGSTDGTGGYIDLLKADYSDRYYKTLHTGGVQFRPDYPQPAGVCHARNLGISLAYHDYILPLDADDTLMPDGIRALYEHASPNVAVYGAHMKLETGEFIHAAPPIRLPKKNVTGVTFLFHRDDWQRAGGYHPDFNLGCEDWAFMAALVSAGVQLVKVDEPIYIYSPGGKRAARCMKYADAIKQLLHEHYPAVFDAQPSR